MSVRQGDAYATDLNTSAQTALRLGRLGESRNLFAEAARAARAEGDTTALVEAAVGIGGLWVLEQRQFLERAEVEQLWTDALEAVASDSLAAARIQTRRAAEAVYDGGPAEAVDHWAALVTGFGDDASSAEALSLLHHVHLGPAHAESRLRLAEEIVHLGTRCQQPHLGLMGLCWRTADLYLLGDNRADQSLEELRERAAGCEAIAFIADVMAAMRLARRGDLDGAEALAGLACNRGDAAGDPDAAAYFGALLSALRWWQGRGSEIIHEVRHLATSPRLASSAHAYVANAALSSALGDFDATAEALAWLTGTGLDAIPDSSSWLTTLFLVTEAAFSVGDEDVAAEAGRLLTPYAKLPVMPSLAVVCLGSVKRSLGLAAATSGRLDEAVGWLEGAVIADRRLGNRPMAVLTEHVLAQILAARGAEGDPARAAELFSHSSERAQRIGVHLPPSPAWLAEGSSRRHRAQLTKTARYWTLDVDRRATFVPDSIGMGYLVALIGAPNRDHHALQLVAGDAALVAGGLDGQPLIDSRSLASYRARMRELTVALETLAPDAPASAGIREELQSIRRVLRASTRLDGAARDFPTGAERARTSVRKALVRAIRTIGEAEPALAAHLDRAVTTGSECRYQSEPGWTIEVVQKRPAT